MGDVGSVLHRRCADGHGDWSRGYALLLPIIALAMMVSSLSDHDSVWHISSITHGKRIFRMAPLHHHFELSGMPETRVTAMYYIVTALLCLVALLGFVK